MGDVLEVIRDSVTSDGTPAESLIPAIPQEAHGERLFLDDDDSNWGYYEEQAFHDGGEGAGIEGDLETEDD
jgi:hypothetical protein